MKDQRAPWRRRVNGLLQAAEANALFFQCPDESNQLFQGSVHETDKIVR